MYGWLGVLPAFWLDVIPVSLTVPTMPSLIDRRCLDTERRCGWSSSLDANDRSRQSTIQHDVQPGARRDGQRCGGCRGTAPDGHAVAALGRSINDNWITQSTDHVVDLPRRRCQKTTWRTRKQLDRNIHRRAHTINTYRVLGPQAITMGRTSHSILPAEISAMEQSLVGLSK